MAGIDRKTLSVAQSYADEQIKNVQAGGVSDSYLQEQINKNPVIANMEENINSQVNEYLANDDTMAKVEKYNYYLNAEMSSTIDDKNKVMTDVVDGELALNGRPTTSVNPTYSKVLLESGSYIFQFKYKCGKRYSYNTSTSVKTLLNENVINYLDFKIIVTDISTGTKTTHSVGSGGIIKITNAKLRCEFTVDSKSYVEIQFYLANTYYYEDFTIDVCLAKKDLFVDNFTNAMYCIKDNVKLLSNINKYIDVLYFSETGDDENNGLTPQTPKKDPTSFCGYGGYTILLKSGDTFYLDGIIIASDTTISTYGGSGYATISGIRESTNTFELYDADNSIYSLQFSSNVNPGFIMFDDNIKLWSRKLTNSLSNDKEWYFDTTNYVLYMKSSVDITGKSVRYSMDKSAIEISRARNVTISNIEVYGYSNHGISLSINVDNVHIKKNYIHHIGGGLKSSEHKYGNGIQMWLINETNIFIENNIVTDCYDAGITPQVNSSVTGQTKDCENIYVLDNEIRRCAYPIEYFNAKEGTYSCKNIVFADNYLYDCIDITNGYRETSDKNQMALICLWRTLGTNDSVYLINNIGIKSVLSAISFSGGTKENYHFTNNIFLLVSETPVKNEEYYSGNDTFITVSDTPTTAEELANMAYYIAVGNEKVKMMPKYEYEINP